MAETSGSEHISPKLQRVAELAKAMPHGTFTTLAHHMDLDLLLEAYRRTRKDGAVGVDGQSGQEYAETLEENLRGLLERAKAGTYHAPPVRRVRIPKGTGAKTRPIGIPTFEDKVLQRAVAMLLGAVYEQEFRACSYGFRPRRSAHQALQVLWEAAMRRQGGWVLELDIEDFFGSLDHQRLRGIRRRRVRDGVVLRLIGKWLRAGVREAGTLTYPEAGTPQGGVISPLLANVYLHEALDEWFEDVVPRDCGARRPSCALRTMLSSSLLGRKTRGEWRRCCRSGWRDTGSRSIRRKPASSPFSSRDRPVAAWEHERAPSISWASRTTGATPGEGTRS